MADFDVTFAVEYVVRVSDVPSADQAALVVEETNPIHEADIVSAPQVLSVSELN